MQAKAEKRGHTRLPAIEEMEVDFPALTIEVQSDILPFIPLKVMAMDISNTGIGLASEVPLKVGQLVKFPENQPDWELPKAGVVMWTFKAHDGFRAGVKFV